MALTALDDQEKLDTLVVQMDRLLGCSLSKGKALNLFGVLPSVLTLHRTLCRIHTCLAVKPLTTLGAMA